MPQCDSPRLVVVDDEPGIRGLIADYLGRDGYTVKCCGNGRELDAVLKAGGADVVVLDVSLPGEDGLSIARRLKAAGSTSIIMLTALDDIVDRIVGLEVGADDYMTKPFDLRELRTRVRVLLRRGAAASTPRNQSRQADGSLACFGKVFLDVEKNCLVDRDGVRLAFTAMEFDLLATFARHPNTVLSRDHLMDAFSRDADPCDRSIDIRVTRIRKKVEIDPSKPQIIKTVRSAGYIYVPPA